MANDNTIVGNRISDQLHDFYRISLSYNDVLVEEQSEFQNIKIVQTEVFGRVLLLDGVIQLTEKDNCGYHEMITHVPLLTQKEPKHVFVVGGGDGGTLQQVLKYPSIEKVTVCELDRRVVELCGEYFPQFGRPFGDERVELVIEDAFTYLERVESGSFDAILSDTTDPIGEAEKLFTEEFYRLMANALKKGGAIAAQCEQMYFDLDLIQNMLEIGKKFGSESAYYYSIIPTYPGGGIGFLYVSDTPWTAGLGKQYPDRLKYLNSEIHKSAFALPEFAAVRLRPGRI